MKKYLFSILLIGIIAANAIAQESPKIDKNEFISGANGDAEKGWNCIKKGNKAYRHHKSGYYIQAADFYQQAIEINESNAALLYKAGVSLLGVSQNKKALEYLDDAISLSPNITKDIQLYYALALQRNNKFKEAEEAYNDYLNFLSSKKTKVLKSEIDRRIIQCENGIKIAGKSQRIGKIPLGDGINTVFGEYSPVFANVDSSIYFTTRSPYNMARRHNPVDHQFYEDIFISKPEKGVYQEATNADKPLNKRRHDASISISADGTQLLIRRSGRGNGKFKIVEKKNNEWKNAKNVLGKFGSKKSIERSLCFSTDSSKVLFTSNRKKGTGGNDIYICERKSNGKWGKIKNFGAPINTIYDEACAVFAPGDTVIYFSSNGEKSIGGYDLMKTTLREGQWSEPENMGLAINSGDDELFFNFIPGSSRFGLYASRSAEGKGDYDIYKVVILDKAKPEMPALYPHELAAQATNEPILDLEGPAVIKTMRLTVIKGKVTDFEGEKNLPSTIEIVDLETNTTLQKINNDPLSGDYTVMIPSGKNYSMTVSSNGYMFNSENFNIPSATGYQEIRKDVRLLSMDPGSKVILNNVFFDTGKSELRRESYPELERLAGVFKLYPDLAVEISGHTDNKGSRKTNIKLSQSRAKSVVDYLISIGVNASKLSAKGYGPDQPRDTNKTEGGRQNNRRVEAKILKR